MELLDSLILGLNVALSPTNLLFCLVGVILWLVWRGHVREAAPARARSASRA